MYLRKRALLAATALVVGCSGQVGNGDNWGAQDEPTPSVGSPDPSNPTTPQPGATTIDNGDGTTTIINPDGSQVTLDEDGNVISTTPAPAPPVTDPTRPSVVGKCTPGTPKTTQLPRLTNLQFDNTIRELLGVDLALGATTLASESKGNMDSATWKGFQAAAAIVANTIFSDPQVRSRVIPCATEDKACATHVISDFGAKVFRRPLTDLEVAKYEAVFDDTQLSANGTFDEQLSVVLEAMFQSPYFLTIAEVSESPTADVNGEQRFELDGYEVASRLSYMLWNSMPDAALLTAAGSGELSTADGIASHVTRMLADDRAAHLVRQMHTGYMRMGPGSRWEGYARDASKYQTYSPDQTPFLSEETLLLAQSVFDSGGSFADLMTSTKGFVNATTAPLYGLDPADFGAELQEVDLGPSRPGILTRAGFLATNAYGNRTSPIHRGAFIQKFVLCTQLGDPDPAAAATPLPDREGLITNRQKTDAQTEAVAGGCKGCHHSIINPTGFALEGFDAVGGVQTTEEGVAIETEADVPIDGVPVHVTGAVDLMNALSTSSGAYQCYSKKWVELGYNRVISEQDACTITEIANRMGTQGYSIKQLVTDLTTIESFRYRALEN